jgi:3-methyladenine DNA glycosylase/8-oxoguanine DNA glycosylase
MIESRPCGVRVVDAGKHWQVTVFATEGWSALHTDTLRCRLVAGYGLHEDASVFYDRFTSDTVLAPAIRDLRGMRSSCPESVFELLILAVLLQNTTVHRSRDMLNALLDLAGGDVLFDGVQLAHFCSPSILLRLGVGPLREVARVGYREKTLLAIADFFTKRPHDETSGSRHDLLGELCGIRGIGPYTAGVAAASAFRDPRAYGLDVWNRRILAGALGAPEDVQPDDLKLQIKSRFAPFEGIAVEFLVEHAYFNNPVCRVYPTEEDARRASEIWPRSEKM